MGLAVSLLMVAYDSGLAPSGVASRFAGPETDQVYPHTFGSLLQTTHTHLYTLAFFEFLLGGLFLLSSAAPRLKVAVISIAWAAILLDHAGMWMVFAWGRGWVWAMMVGGISMTSALALQLAWCLKDLSASRGDPLSK
jgi:hypothetical protein